MRNFTVLAGMVSGALLIAGCQNTEEDSEESTAESTVESSENNNENAETENNDHEGGGSSGSSADTADQNKNTEEESLNEAEDNESITYAGTQETSKYFIGTHSMETEVDDVPQFYTAFSIERDEDKQLSYEERVKKSIVSEDPSEQEILSSYTNISIDWPELDLHFSEDESKLSTSSAISKLFYDSLYGISDLYGIEEISFVNSNKEQYTVVAERGFDKPVKVKDERGLTRGYYTIYDKELEQTLFLAGGELEEVENDRGEPLSFSDTIEEMKIVDLEDAFYSSAIVEGIEIYTSMTDNRIATVQYTMDEDIVTEADRIVFERAMQLTALDFHAWEIRLVNDTTEEFITYPLVGNE